MDQTLDRSRSTLPLDPPQVRQVALSQPLTWLRLGASDLAREPGMSLAVGAVVAAVGVLLLTAGWKACWSRPSSRSRSTA
jgi:uncharacterized membrane protein